MNRFQSGSIELLKPVVLTLIIGLFLRSFLTETFNAFEQGDNAGGLIAFVFSGGMAYGVIAVWHHYLTKPKR